MRQAATKKRFKNKSQITKYKSQINYNLQYSETQTNTEIKNEIIVLWKYCLGHWDLKFGIYLLFVIWFLWFVICALARWVTLVIPCILHMIRQAGSNKIPHEHKWRHNAFMDSTKQKRIKALHSWTLTKPKQSPPASPAPLPCLQARHSTFQKRVPGFFGLIFYNQHVLYGMFGIRNGEWKHREQS